MTLVLVHSKISCKFRNLENLMKKKKWLVPAAFGLALLTLSACAPSQSNANAAKKTFIKDVVALNDTSVYNAQEFTLKVADFKASGEDASEMNKLLTGSSLQLNVNLDKAHQLASLSGQVGVNKASYALSLLMSEKGIYLKSDDLKNIYKASPAGSSSSQIGTIYGGMIEGLTKPYFLLDDQTINAGASSTADGDGTTEDWSSTFNTIFENKNTTKEELNNALKDVPASAFSQKGDKVTFKISGNDISFSELIKGLSQVNNLPKEQVDTLIKESKSLKAEHVALDLTLNEKTHRLNGTIAAKLKDTEQDSNVTFKLDLDAKRSKLKTALKEPTSSEVDTLSDLQNAYMTNLETQAGLSA